MGSIDFEGYIMVEKDNIQLHFFEYQLLNPSENYEQVYIRVNNIKLSLHIRVLLQTKSTSKLSPYSYFFKFKIQKYCSSKNSL